MGIVINRLAWRKEMKLKIIIAVISVLILLSCGEGGTGGTEGKKSFDGKLLGEWESADKSVYSGKIEIEYRRFKVTGYEESQTIKYGDDSKRPFKEYVKGVYLEGYSEEGKIYIKTGGEWKEGLDYKYWVEKDFFDYYEAEFLKFKFGVREEILRKKKL